MSLQFEYKNARLEIKDIYNKDKVEIAIAFMNNLGKEGWEIFEIRSKVLLDTEYINYICKRIL